MKQKILAIFLSVVMLLGMLPASVLAGATDGATAENTLPAGTVGYVMDVPETEQYIGATANGVKCFGYSSYMFMKNTAANAADPFSDSVTDYIGDGNGGAFVRVVDGEEFIVINPAEVEYADFVTSTQTNTTETTDDEGNTTTNEDRVVSTTTDKADDAGKRYRFLGQIWFNGISSIENTSITSDVTGLPLINDADEASITHVAIRIKVVGGQEDQLSVLYEPNGTTLGFNTNYAGVYYVDIKTGAITPNEVRDVVALPRGDFDGYMVVPTTATRLQAANHMYLYTYGATTQYYKNSDWSGRVLCMGDTYAVTDEDAFAAQFKPVKVPAPADTSKNILTVPDAGGAISYNNSHDTLATKNFNWGMARWSSNYLFTSAKSITENGENFFSQTIGTLDNSKTIYRLPFNPASYELNVPFNVVNETGDAWALDSAGKKIESPTAAISELYSDAADYSYIALRFKVTGGADGASSKMGIHVGTGADPITLNGVTMINYTDGKTTTLNGIKEFDVPYNFDGWFILPQSTFSSTTIPNVKRVGYGFYRDADSTYTTWIGKTVKIGDMKIFKDYDAFIKANGLPAFEVTVSASGLEITNDADTNKDVLYSVDKETWMDIDAINDLTYTADTKHTVYAKYPWSVNTAIASKTVFNAVDTATMLMPAVDKIYYPGYNYGTYGLGYSSSRTMRNNTNTGWTTGDSNQYLFATTLDGERYWNVVDNPNESGCRQFSIYPLFKKKIGEVYSDAATRFSHLAIRIRVEEDGSDTAVEGATYPLSLNLQGSGGSDANYGKWAEGDGDVYFYDITTGEKTLVTSISPSIPLGFNGYVIFPSESVYDSDVVKGDNPETSKVETEYYVNYHYGDISDMERLHVFMHNGDHYSSKEANWTGVTLYLGDMELIEDDEAFISVRSNCEYTGKHYINAVEAIAPSAENKGTVAHYACVSCGETYADAEGTIPMNPSLLTFYSASLTLEQNTAVNFKVDADRIAGLTNVYAKFTFNGAEKIVEANAELDKNGRYVFTFDDIGPQHLAKTITAQLFGTYEGVEYAGEEITYSVKEYCYNKLAEYEKTEGKEAFRTLLVDLLYYGAKAQVYTNTDVTDLVSDELGYVGSINRTIAAPTITGGVKGIYDDLDDASTLAAWKSVNLFFEDAVSLKFKFEIASTEGVTVKVTDAKDGGNVLAEISEFAYGFEGTWIALFDGLDATEMRKTVYVAVYKDGVKVSDTLAYDIVSYAKEIITKSYVNYIKTSVNGVKTSESWPSDPYKNLKSLLSYMLRYGDSAAAYAATLNA